MSTCSLSTKGWAFKSKKGDNCGGYKNIRSRCKATPEVTPSQGRVGRQSGHGRRVAECIGRPRSPYAPCKHSPVLTMLRDLSLNLLRDRVYNPQVSSKVEKRVKYL